jgi:hypothetical protein
MRQFHEQVQTLTSRYYFLDYNKVFFLNLTDAGLAQSVERRSHNHNSIRHPEVVSSILTSRMIFFSGAGVSILKFILDRRLKPK